MNVLIKTQTFAKTITLCGTAALMFSVAPILPGGFLSIEAHAAGQGGQGSGGQGGGGQGGGGQGGDQGGGQGSGAGGSDDGESDQGNANPSLGSSDGESAAESAATAPKKKPAETTGSANQSAGNQGNAGTSTGGQGGNVVAGQPQGAGETTLADVYLDITGDDDDSDRPDWSGEPGGKDGAGGGQPSTSGSKKGDLFGDLFVIARDDDGIPLLTPEGWVQPIDADGNLIALDDEGHPLDESLTLEVELGRLNVGRAPISVLEKRADEVITLMQTATEVSTDAAGRLVFTVDGVDKTIDSPLENLAIYKSLMTTGTIPGVTDLPGTEFDYLVDGQLTGEDLVASAVFLAAATDKTGVFTPDEIAYINTFLDVNTVTTGTVTYSDVDFSEFTYSREDTYADVTVNVLVQQDDGSWMPTVINVYNEVFAGVPVDGAGTLTAYTLAADDARSVVNFIHEYEVPAEDLALVSH